MSKNLSDEMQTGELSGRSMIMLALLSIVAGVSAILVGVLFSAVWYAWGGLAAIGIAAMAYLGVRYVSAHRHSHVA